MQHDWIAINSKAIHGGGITSFDGMLMDFESSEAKLNHIFFDSTLTYSFDFKEEQIFLDDSLFGKIEFISDDSLLINFDDWMLTKYIPVEKNEILIDENELIENEWIYRTENGYKTLEIFTDINWGRFPNETAKICVEQYLDSKFKGIDQERWSLMNVDNSSVLSIAWGQIDPAIYFIESKSTDSILLKCWLENESHTIVLKKIPNLNKNKLDSIINLIIDKTWKISEVIDYVHQFSDDSLLNHIGETGITIRDTIFLKKESLLNKTLSYSFNKDFTYKIFDNSQL